MTTDCGLFIGVECKHFILGLYFFICHADLELRNLGRLVLTISSPRAFLATSLGVHLLEISSLLDCVSTVQV